MPAWFWLNIPLMVLAFALTVGIPLRMVLKDRAISTTPEPEAIADIERDREFVSV